MAEGERVILQKDSVYNICPLVSLSLRSFGNDIVCSYWFSDVCVLVWRLLCRKEIFMLEQHSGQWLQTAAADLVYTNELRYEMASPLLSRWFVRRGRSSPRNEISPLFIFFSTWNYAPYEVNQMLTRAREDSWRKLHITSSSKKINILVFQLHENL